MFRSCSDTEDSPGSSSGPVYPDIQLSTRTETVVLLGGDFGKNIYIVFQVKLYLFWLEVKSNLNFCFWFQAK